MANDCQTVAGVRGSDTNAKRGLQMYRTSVIQCARPKSSMLRAAVYPYLVRIVFSASFSEQTP